MPIFDGFTDDEVDRIKNAGTFVTLPADWSPIWEKTPADKAYILLSGEVSVRRGGEEIATARPRRDLRRGGDRRSSSLRNASIVSLSKLRGAPHHQRRRARAVRRGARVPRGARRHGRRARWGPDGDAE